MAKKIQAFQADDGSLHKTADEAEQHDVRLALCEALGEHGCVSDDGVETIAAMLQREFEIKRRSPKTG